MDPPHSPSYEASLRHPFWLFPILLLLGGCGPVAEHYNQKGAEAFQKSDLPQARDAFQRAVLLKGGNPAYRNNLGYALYLLKDYEKSEVQYRKALEDGPEPPLKRQVQIDLALLYCDPAAWTGKPALKEWNGKGIKLYEELLKGEPDNAEFHMRLGFAYFQSANPGGGFEHLEQAVRYADPKIVGRYTPNAVAGALGILRQVQGFYLKIQYVKKSAQIEKRIAALQKQK